MDNQILTNIVCGIGGLVIGALIAHLAGRAMFNREITKLRLSWRHESRMKGLEPVREYLDKLRFLVDAAKQQAILRRSGDGDNAELNALIVEKFFEAQNMETGTDFSVGDFKLNDLLRELRFDNKDHVRFISPNLWFSARFRDRLRRAYARLDELAAEI